MTGPTPNIRGPARAARTLRRLARRWMRGYAAAYREGVVAWRYGPALGPTAPLFPLDARPPAGPDA